MRHFAFAALLIVPAGCAAAAHPPVCAGPAVLGRVAAMLQEAGRPMRLFARPVGEESVGTGRIVHCAARGQVLGYDTNRSGMQPIDEMFVVHYTLELRRNGIFISLQ